MNDSFEPAEIFGRDIPRMSMPKVWDLDPGQEVATLVEERVQNAHLTMAGRHQDRNGNRSDVPVMTGDQDPGIRRADRRDLPEEPTTFGTSASHR